MLYEAYETFMTSWIQAIDDGDEEMEALQFAMLEDLMERRPLLLSSVTLRQNPHVVVEVSLVVLFATCFFGLT